jgi:hypothetical protein
MTARREVEGRRSRSAPPRRPPLPRGAVVALGAVAVLVLFVLLLRGCGDDSLSAKELRSQAGEICARANAVTDRVAVPNAQAGGERFLREGLAQLAPASERLAALKPPSELRDDYEQAVTLMRQEVSAIRRAAVSIRSGGEVIDTFSALQQRLSGIVNVENSTWETLDIPACIRR